MNAQDCVLAATGPDTSVWMWVVLALALIGVGAIVGLTARRRRGVVVGGALALVLLGGMIVTAPAEVAVAADSCPTASPTPAVAPTTTPTPTPTEDASPDLTPTIAAPSEPIDGSADFVVTVANVGPAATQGQIVVTITVAPEGIFALTSDPSATSATVGGTITVGNSVWTATGAGTAASPLVLTTDAVIAPGAELNFSVLASVMSNDGDTATISVVITPGTGGGETPVDNNSVATDISTTFQDPCGLSDKSPVSDSDGDGVVDGCDLDSDNDGILDSEEDLNRNGRFGDDDVDGDILLVAVLGDGVSTYLDLDSDNDGILDLMEGRAFTRAQIDAFDADHNGVFDANQSFGSNGLLDALETLPDSGALKPEFTALRNTDGDDKFDFNDLTSNGVEYDLYAIGRADLDVLGGGFISQLSDTDQDGIQAAVDTDLVNRGAPGSPYSPYSS